MREKEFEMFLTQNYRTKTNFIERQNICAGNYWGIALDIGYSGVKGVSPNMVFCFPSFARKYMGQTIALGEPGPEDIQYKDEQGVIWNVGSSAQNIIASNDSNDNIYSLYGRNRYFSPMFQVIARTGLGLGMLANQYGCPDEKTITLQTGLPPDYLRSDVGFLKEVLAGRHEFELRIGRYPWKKFSFDLPESNIRVMPQPMGSLLSAAFKNDLKKVEDANKYFTSNILVFDAGFGTLDTYSLRNGQAEKLQPSYDDLGMKAVLMDVSERIYQLYDVEIPVHAMQKCLQNGYIKVFDRKAMRSIHVDFSEILWESTRKICLEAIERVKHTYNYLLDFDYLLITGGTGAAWQDIISEHFAEMEGLQIITGNQNDNLSHIYSNVRGYYLYQVGALQKVSTQ